MRWQSAERRNRKKAFAALRLENSKTRRLHTFERSHSDQNKFIQNSNLDLGSAEAKDLVVVAIVVSYF